jgi:uroporphyrinogen decarboxylase
MNNRERISAILHFQPYDHLPVVHFGYWNETLDKWAEQGHITPEQARTWGDGNLVDQAIGNKLGFDLNYYTTLAPNAALLPAFERQVIEELPDGSKKILDPEGAVELFREGAGSIPARVDHLLKDRRSWNELYLPRLQFAIERVNHAWVFVGGQARRFDQGGREALCDPNREEWAGLHCGSLYGTFRNWIGMEQAIYLLNDDEPLFDEIVEWVGELCYRNTEAALASGAVFDFAHFWEDICFKSGPLISPRVFRKKIGPLYQRITELVGRHGLDIVSLDCDGKIDALVPIWLDNGVNTMFPIEVGTWGASIAPWREQYGRTVRGVGGMNKTILAYDYAAVDAEVERLKPLVALGGYVPCPDHRIAPDAKWENVQYYCERMRATFG